MSDARDQEGGGEPQPSTVRATAPRLPFAQPVDYLRAVYRRRWQIGAVVLLVLATGAAHTFMAVPIYEAQATVLIESDEPHVVDFEKVLDERTALGDYYQTQYQLLESRVLLERTVHTLGVAKLGASTDAAAIGAVRAGLRITPVRGSRIVAIRFRGTDPALAADIANAHARQYIEQSLDNRFNASKEATEWLAQQLESERQRVQERELALQAYREEHDGLALKDGQDIVIQKLADLNAAVTKAKTSRIEREAEYRELTAAERNKGELESYPAILANPFIQQLKSDLARLQREYSQMSQALGDRHPTLLEKRSELQSVEARLTTEVAKVVESVKNAYQEASVQEASLTRVLDQQKREALALNRRGVEYAALEREAESVRSVYQSLLQRAKETGVARELRGTNLRIIDPAQVPRVPVSPRPIADLLIALLAGVTLALALAFTLESLDDRIKTPDDVSRELGVPFIGLIPELRSGTSIDALLHDAAPAALVEAVRAMRTSVVASSSGGQTGAIVVASAGESEGKTFVAANLAVALAQAHQRVLLVDADMRRPRVHDVFDRSLEPGLSDVLEGAASLQSVLRPTAVQGLTLVSAGRPSKNAPELLGSELFTSLFEIVQEHYAWVIIDSPPALRVTDATVIAGHAGRILFVVGSGRTKARAARTAIEELQRAGGVVLGAVLNRANVQHDPFSYAPYERGDYGDARVDRVASAAPRPITALGRSA